MMHVYIFTSQPPHSWQMRYGGSKVQTGLFESRCTKRCSNLPDRFNSFTNHANPFATETIKQSSIVIRLVEVASAECAHNEQVCVLPEEFLPLYGLDSDPIKILVFFRTNATLWPRRLEHRTYQMASHLLSFPLCWLCLLYNAYRAFAKSTYFRAKKFHVKTTNTLAILEIM